MSNADGISVETDVLIVGGGLAGLNAAMGAAEFGARVLVVDKGGIARSGSIGGGVDHFLAYLEAGESWDTREAYLAYMSRVARGAVNLPVHDSLYCRGLRAAIGRLAAIGNPLTQPDGTFYRTASMGSPGPYFINFNGKYLKPRLAEAVRRLGCQVLEKTTATNLLVKEGQVVGAVAFHIRSGQLYVLRSKATVVCTGRIDRLFENPMGMPFNTWQCPANTGGAQAMAFRAGAALTNMEYVRMTVVPRGFSAAGLNALTGMGGRFINALGEEFMARYHPLGDRAPRYKLVEGVMAEVQEGRGPVFIDCRHLSERDLAHLKTTLGYDKDTLPDFFAQKGVDLAKEPLEVMVAEGHIGGPFEGCGSGVLVDEHCASTLPGLFAAGDSCDQSGAAHSAVTSGYLAGQAAARSVEHGPWPEPDPRQLRTEKERIRAPLERQGGLHYREVEEVLAKVMGQHVGPTRTEASLRMAQSKLARLEGCLRQLRAADGHELMRALEVQDLLLLGRVMIEAALYRQESRFGVYHRRLDFPEEDAKGWLGQVIVQGRNGAIRTSFRPLSYPAT